MLSTCRKVDNTINRDFSRSMGNIGSIAAVLVANMSNEVFFKVGLVYHYWSFCKECDPNH